MFDHCPPKELLELETEAIAGKRHYITPSGSYPSITTILSAFPKPELMEWKKRVGEAEANRISSLATSRGTKIHSLCEQYLLNEEIDKSKFMPDVLDSFYSFKPLLNNISNIHYLEAPLYSNKLKCAGRVDAIGHYNNKLSIIDFKTSRKEKREEWITDYFIQATAYSLMYYELTGIATKQIVILISVDDGENQAFIKPVKEFVSPLIKKINDYYKYYHFEKT